MTAQTATTDAFAETTEEQGYLRDFITGERIRATPEERDAVQVMLRRLVLDYGYPAEHIQSHPQHRVRRSPSDKKGTYPVDIAVFSSANKAESELSIVVECKRPERVDGREQLELYMEMSSAQIGIWFNGSDHLYLRKVVSPSGERHFEELPNFPKFGQTIDEVGQHLRGDLEPSSNLKSVFGDLRNHLAGNLVGITRDEALAREILNLVFCKIYDEINTGQDEVVQFRASPADTPEEVAARIEALFEHVVNEYWDVFSDSDKISIDPENLVYIVGELQYYDLSKSERDAVGDAFEVFIGPSLRGTEGQFFTPRNVVKMLVEMIDPSPGDTIIDPACGSGGFLIGALDHIWSALKDEGEAKGWSEVDLERRKRDVASRCFRGIEKDTFLAKVTKAYMAIMGDGRGGIFCANSLESPSTWDDQLAKRVELGKFDVVVTNPPFGSKIKVKGKALIGQYELGHKWKQISNTDSFEPTASIYADRPPQILFLERCIQLLKPGGKLGVVLPESMLGNPSYRSIMHWLNTNATINAVVALPEPLFKTSGKGGTHTKVAVLIATKSEEPSNFPVFMSEVRWCGHDSRGNPTIREIDGESRLLDEVPVIATFYKDHESGVVLPPGRLAHQVDREEVRSNIWIPKYYDPRISRRVDELAQTHEIISLGDLVDDGLLTITTGVEVGKMAYGTGAIPFIRTSDLSNWELKADPKHCVSEEIYAEYQAKCDVAPGDILMVRDGTYLIGTSAMITKEDGRLLFQSHLYRLRLDADGSGIDHYLFFGALNSEFVEQQIRAYQFTQDIIDTLGRRISEVRVAIPKSGDERQRLSEQVREIVEERARLRSLSASIASEVAPGFEVSSIDPSSIR